MRRQNKDPDKRCLAHLNTLSKMQWLKTGVHRRAGVATPLFSLHSKTSIGVGDSEDLKKLVDWCDVTGLSIIQLLPLNDVGFNFWPYDAQSIYALEPMHLALPQLFAVDHEKFAADIENLRKKFPCTGIEYDHGVKRAKLDFLRKVFEQSEVTLPQEFAQFVQAQKFWLEDYVLFKVIQANFHDQSWESWPDAFKYRDAKALRDFSLGKSADLNFHRWLQWQLFEQFKSCKEYAESKNVFLMGDMPYLCSRNSDYVWSHQDHFKLDLSSGAPPDVDFAKGQRWGMPPYNWDAIARSGYESLIQKLRYAENFYHLYRIDHVVGIFRVWTISNRCALEDHGLHGVFDPQDEGRWEAHGRNLLSVMIQNTKMLACAEDLGTVPDCAVRVMAEFGIPGLDIQRWTKDWNRGCEFKQPDQYRVSAISAVSTHDTSSLRAWWQDEIGTVNGPVFERWCAMYGISFSSIKDQLFDLAASRFGRLVWRREFQDQTRFLQVLGRRAEDIPVLMSFYHGSIREKEQFERLLFGENVPVDYEKNIEKIIFEKALAASSIFSIQLLQDWLSLDPSFEEASRYDYRINFPSTLDERNWHLRIPYSMEALMDFRGNKPILSMVQKTGRA